MSQVVVTEDNADRLLTNQAEKRRTARRRWNLLARALGSLRKEEPEDVSLHRFTSFNLITVERLKNESCWYKYTAFLRNTPFGVLVRHVDKGNFTASQLMGFNNTGNICVWPSEECLAYYLLRNCDICWNRRVLELGGGMTCLAGVLVAKYCNSKVVTLTDGNPTSVENVRRILMKNNMDATSSGDIRYGIVQWNQAASHLQIPKSLEATARSKMDEVLGEELYDVILCADCLFFDEGRVHLVDTIYGWLTENGIALVMAPRRGETFQKFAEAAIERGFIARQTENYDNEVWIRHLQLLEENQDYTPDIHYPVLLELTKQKKTPPG